MKGKSFLSIKDITKEKLYYLLDLSKALKEKKRQGIEGELLKGKNIVLIFDKPSTRTRCAFETAVYDEGGNVTYLTNSQFYIKESIEDGAKVLGAFYDGIAYRGFSQEVVLDLAKFSGIPVWNALTDTDHPTQVLADFLTIQEHCLKPLKKVKLVFVGDTRNNVCYALMYGAAKSGMHFIALGPKELAPDRNIIADLKSDCDESGAIIEYSNDPSIVKNADVIYTDVWISMGENIDVKKRVEMLTPYRVTMDMIKATKNPDVLFMHCLPSFHDFETVRANDMLNKNRVDIREVTDEVFHSKHSVVFYEAENRLHTIKAVIVVTLT